MSEFHVSLRESGGEFSVKFRTDPGLPASVTPLTVSENGVYNAGDEAAYNPVTVQVPQTEVQRLAVTENGSYQAPSGAAYSPVVVDVPQTEVEPLAVTENGTYRPPSGTAYGPVTVAVPNSYSASDEGKVVSGGELVAQTALTVTENGTVDTTTKNSVTVNVALPETPDETKPVLFFDYDGTLLYAFTLEELQALTALPELPQHEGLTAKGWNWTLAELKAANAPATVGALYGTTDGAHRFYINIQHDDQRKLDLCFRLNGTAEIDWGDGSEIQTLTLVMTMTVKPPLMIHEYAATGRYCISVKVLSGKISGAYNYGTILQFAQKESFVLSGNNGPNAGCVLERVEGGNGADIDFAWFSSFSPTRIKSLAIPDKTWFNADASRQTSLANCPDIPFLTIPAGTKKLNFNGDRSLVSVALPSDLTSMDANTFANCYGLRRLTLPPLITELPTGLCQNCSQLRAVHLPAGLTKIGNNSFSTSENLTEISLPSSLTVIGSSAFNGSGLVSVAFPDGLESIGQNAFQLCNNLTTVAFPHGIREIGNQAFNGCRNVWLYDFTVWTIADLAACTFGTNIFQNITVGTEIRFATKSVADYAATVSNLAAYASYMTYEEDDT